MCELCSKHSMDEVDSFIDNIDAMMNVCAENQFIKYDEDSMCPYYSYFIRLIYKLNSQGWTTEEILRDVKHHLNNIDKDTTEEFNEEEYQKELSEVEELLN